jgi:hypothetical protein
MAGGGAEESREAGDGEVGGAIGRERGAEKAQRDKNKLKVANEKRVREISLCASRHVCRSKRERKRRRLAPFEMTVGAM